MRSVAHDPSGVARIRRALASAFGWVGVRLDTQSMPRLLPAAIWCQRLAVVTAGRTSPDYPVHLSNLGVSYEQLYRRGLASALTSMIAAHTAALARVRAESSDRVTIMNNLSSALLARYEIHGVPDDLDRAQAALEEAVAACPPTHPDRVAILVNAATAQFLRLDRIGDRAAVRAGIALCAEAAEEVSSADPLAADIETLRGQLLHSMAEASGSGADLDAAIEHLESAVLMAERSRGDTAHARTALARALRLRADRYGRLQDLTRAIGHIEVALAATPIFHAPSRHGRTGTLAVLLASRFQWTRDPADIDAAIAMFDHLRTVDDPRALRHQANLAVCLTERAATAEARPDDLSRAIDLLRSITGVPTDAATGSGLWAALADALVDRADEAGFPDDLTEAHRAAEEAVRSCPPGGPMLARHVGVLGETHLAQYHADRGEQHIDAAIRAYADAFGALSALPRERIRAALLWSYCAATADRFSEAVHAHDQGRLLVPRLLAPDLLPTDGLRLVEDLAEAGPDALALSLQTGRPDLGLERAEQWRDLVLGPDRARREQWTHLLAAHPDLGERLQSVIARSAAAPGEDLLPSGHLL